MSDRIIRMADGMVVSDELTGESLRAVSQP
jgi:hypothetical protein